MGRHCGLIAFLHPNRNRVRNPISIAIAISIEVFADRRAGSARYFHPKLSVCRIYVSHAMAIEKRGLESKAMKGEVESSKPWTNRPKKVPSIGMRHTLFIFIHDRE